MEAERDDGRTDPVDHWGFAGEFAEAIAWEDPLVVVDHIEGEGDGFGLVEILAEIGRAQDSGGEDDGQGSEPDGEGEPAESGGESGWGR